MPMKCKRIHSIILSILLKTPSAVLYQHDSFQKKSTFTINYKTLSMASFINVSITIYPSAVG